MRDARQSSPLESEACAKRKGARCGISAHIYTIFVVMIAEGETSRVGSLIPCDGEEILHTKGKANIGKLRLLLCQVISNGNSMRFSMLLLVHNASTLPAS